jgi:hypothetical protein
MSKPESPGPQQAADPSRRQWLRGGLAAGSAALIPLVNSSCSTPPAPAAVSALGAASESVLAAVADRLLPADALGPAASALGAVTYINRSLLEWNQRDLPLLQNGLQALDEAARRRHGRGFVALDAEQQDALLMALEDSTVAEFPEGSTWFNRVHRLVLEGLFSDPWYGGNRDFGGWDLIGYPGAVLASTADMQRLGQRLAPLHTSAYGSEHDGH